jgi:hypothetical protein
MQVPAAMKSSCGFALTCLIAIIAGSADAARPTRATFGVTLRATITKDWNTVSESTEEGCTVVRRSIGHRTVTLRSARPTRVVVSFQSGKAVFSPSAVRFVTVRVAQSGENRNRRELPCGSGTERVRCRPASRRMSGGSFRFARSGRNEISFQAARLPGAGTSCPREPAAVRAIKPGLRDAEGEISEIDLTGGASQTAFASAEATTDLEGPDAGRVVERVRWSLTFTRR